MRDSQGSENEIFHVRTHSQNVFNVNAREIHLFLYKVINQD